MACILAAGIVLTAEAISKQNTKRKLAKAARKREAMFLKAEDQANAQIQPPASSSTASSNEEEEFEELPPYSPPEHPMSYGREMQQQQQPWAIRHVRPAPVSCFSLSGSV